MVLYSSKHRVEASIIMGCHSSKNRTESRAEVDSTTNRTKRAGRGVAVSKFVPGTYEYTGLDKPLIDQLLNADRDIPDRSIRNVQTWAKVVYVYDGDTCHIVIDHKEELTKLKCRVYGIDTPEIRTKNAREKEVGYQARDRFKELTNDRLIWVNIINNSDDKYGRYLVKFFMDSEEVYPIDTILINEGLGYAYFGDTKVKFDEWYK